MSARTRRALLAGVVVLALLFARLASLWRFPPRVRLHHVALAA